jgi:zinc transporter ZupT
VKGVPLEERGPRGDDEFGRRDAARPAPAAGGAPLWLRGVLPLVLLAFLVAIFLRFGPVGVFQAAFPPVEELTIQRVAFPGEGTLRVHVVNGGPEPVTIAQVTVDEAFWDYAVRPGPVVPRLGSATIDVPYPWVDGEPVAIGVLTSTGLTFTHEVAVATRSPEVDARYLSTFALLGIYVGVIPVFLGLLWLPFLAGVAERWLHFFLAFTVGLLAFLGVDALAEAVELSGAVASAFQGVGLVTLGVLGTPLLIEAVGRLRKRREGSGAFHTAALIALGIGLHNLGEGLAIGSSYAVGEIALGTMLVLGFLLHNATEGLGIVAPLARERPSLGRLAALGAVAGVPTVLGAWIGGFTYSPAGAVLFLAIGAGAVAQVIWTLSRFMARSGGGGLAQPLNAAGLVAGLAVMWTTGLLVAL